MYSNEDFFYLLALMLDTVRSLLATLCTIVQSLLSNANVNFTYLWAQFHLSITHLISSNHGATLTKLNFEAWKFLRVISWRMFVCQEYPEILSGSEVVLNTSTLGAAIFVWGVHKMFGFRRPLSSSKLGTFDAEFWFIYFRSGLFVDVFRDANGHLSRCDVAAMFE